MGNIDSKTYSDTSATFYKQDNIIGGNKSASESNTHSSGGSMSTHTNLLNAIDNNLKNSVKNTVNTEEFFQNLETKLQIVDGGAVDNTENFDSIAPNDIIKYIGEMSGGKKHLHDVDDSSSDEDSSSDDEDIEDDTSESSSEDDDYKYSSYEAYSSSMNKIKKVLNKKFLVARSPRRSSSYRSKSRKHAARLLSDAGSPRRKRQTSSSRSRSRSRKSKRLIPKVSRDRDLLAEQLAEEEEDVEDEDDVDDRKKSDKPKRTHLPLRRSYKDSLSDDDDSNEVAGLFYSSDGGSSPFLMSTSSNGSDINLISYSPR
jgi:hypothetical protein